MLNFYQETPNKVSIFLVCVFSFLNVYIYSQSFQEVTQIKNRDSLWNIWENPKLPDTTRLYALNKRTGLYYSFTNPDSAFYFTDLHYKFARAKNIKKEIAKAINHKGVIYFGMGDLDNAIQKFTEALNEFKKIEAKKESAWAYGNIGAIYQKQGKYNEARFNIEQSIKVYEEATNKDDRVSPYNNLGVIAMAQGNFANAIKNYTKALEIARQLKLEREEALVLNNIGEVYYDIDDPDKALEYYFEGIAVLNAINDQASKQETLINIGRVFSDRKDYQTAIEYVNKALRIQQKVGNKDGLSDSYLFLGKIYAQKSDLQNAYNYYLKSLVLNEEIGLKRRESAALNGLTSVAIKQGDSSQLKGNAVFQKSKYNAALSTGKKALKTAKSIGAIKELREAYYNLFKIYEFINEDSEALKMYKLYVSSRDSLLSESNQREIIKEEFKYNYERQMAADKALSDERLKQEKYKRGVLNIGIVALIIVIAFILYRYQITLKQRKLIQSTLTDLQQTQNQLVQSEKMAALGILTTGIAHEINNPINFIKGSNDALKTIFNDVTKLMRDIDSLPKDDKNAKENYNALLEILSQYNLKEIKEVIPEFIEGLNIGVDRTANITKGLMLYSHKENEAFSQSNLHENIDSALTLLKFNYKNKLDVIKDYDSSIKTILCSPSGLNQVFTNILSNAIYATPENGVITITTKRLNDKVKIFIKDTGHGIPNDIKNRIFDPFFTTKETGKGTGLGLSICQGIINNHNGTMELESEEGKGTEFIITLPINAVK
ncbi:tetratricopeptide repeat-containing sensor histidine kinase [Winogradskyella sp.]